MSVNPLGGGVTVRIDCMIICGFPGIGKTTTYNEMKASDPLAKAVDMDVGDYGTTNGINVEDPVAYVQKMKFLSTTNAIIFATCDPVVRMHMRAASLFYVICMPEFPGDVTAQLALQGMPVPPKLKDDYLKRFENLDHPSRAAQLLEGNGYDAVLRETFDDPMPHIVVPFINKAIINQVWEQIEMQSRTVINPQQLVGMGVQRPTSSFLNEIAKSNGGLPKGLEGIQGLNIPPHLLQN